MINSKDFSILITLLLLYSCFLSVIWTIIVTFWNIYRMGGSQTSGIHWVLLALFLGIWHSSGISHIHVSLCCHQVYTSLNVGWSLNFYLPSQILQIHLSFVIEMLTIFLFFQWMYFFNTFPFVYIKCQWCRGKITNLVRGFLS